MQGRSLRHGADLPADHVRGIAAPLARTGAGHARAHARHSNADPGGRAGVHVQGRGRVSGALRHADRAPRRNALAHLLGNLVPLREKARPRVKDLQCGEIRHRGMDRRGKGRLCSVPEIALVVMEEMNRAPGPRDRHLLVMVRRVPDLLRLVVEGHLVVHAHPRPVAGHLVVLARHQVEADRGHGHDLPGVGILMVQDFPPTATAHGEVAAVEVLLLDGVVVGEGDGAAAVAVVQTGTVIAAGDAKGRGGMGLLAIIEMARREAIGGMDHRVIGAEIGSAAGAGGTDRPGTIVTAHLADGVGVLRQGMVTAGRGLQGRDVPGAKDLVRVRFAAAFSLL